MFALRDEDIFAFDVEEGIVHEFRAALSVIIHVDQVGLRREGSKSGSFQQFPPSHKVLEPLLPRVNFDLQLTERQRLLRLQVSAQERFHRFELPAFDIDFQYVDMGVTVLAHQAIQCIDFGSVVLSMRVLGSKLVLVEVCAVLQITSNLPSEFLGS